MLEFEINEVAKLTKLKPHTLRYYESIGMIQNIKRNAAGKRIYTEQDLKWLEVINRLRQTGMSISQMIEYAKLRHMGDTTVLKRKKIMEEHLLLLEHKIKELLEAKDFVTEKIKIYSEMEEKLNGKGK